MVSTIPKLLTPAEVSEALGVSPATLELWRCTKRYPLPWVKIGRCVRYRLDDVRDFIASRTRGAASDADTTSPSEGVAGHASDARRFDHATPARQADPATSTRGSSR